MTEYGFSLIRIFPHSIWENAGTKNPVFLHILHGEHKQKH